MIHFIYGPSGYGKTHLISESIAKDVQHGVTSYLIVPEQEALTRERDSMSFLPPSAQLKFEVLNFTRLANKLFRHYGGLSYNYINKGTSAVLMWKNLKELSPLLKEYGEKSAKDAGLTESMLSAVKEFKIHGVSPSRLELTANKLPEGSALRAKLLDLALVYASYEGLVDERYSDSLDDIAKATEVLRNNKYFSDANIYIDSFTSFTHSELEMIKVLFAQAKNVTVALACDSPVSEKMHFKSVCDTVKKLKSLAEGKETRETFLTENHRTSSPMLASLEKNLWSFEVSDSDITPDTADGGDSSLSLLSCRDSYTESEAIANKITELVQAGYRYNDIAVITRDASSYLGIIDAAFDKAEIPYFLSEKTDLTSKPLIKFLLSAFRIKFSNWKTVDVVSHVKTGLYNISEKDIDMFEDYVSAWKISGSRFVTGEWNMNPDGYSERLTKRGEAILSAANRVRDAVTLPLLEFFTYIDSSETAKDMCRAIYELMEKLDVKKSLSLLAEKQLASGQRRYAEESIKLYNVTVGVLSDMVAAVGDEEIGADEFASLLKIAFDNADIGSIPTSSDAVTIASAPMFRAAGTKVAILFGLSDGEFPASVNDRGLLTGGEKETLAELGISLSSDALTQNTEELLYVYRAMSCPSDRLIITHPLSESDGKTKKPSSAFLRVKALFPSVSHIQYDSAPSIDRIWDKSSSFEHLSEISRSEEGIALTQVLGADENYKRKLERLQVPISDKYARVDEETVNKVIGRNLSISPSSLEKYVTCHFSYFCDSVMRLRQNESVAFRGNDKGTFIHNVLQKFMEKVVIDNTLNTSLSDYEIYRIIDAVIAEYISAICPDIKESSMRLYSYFMRMRRLTFIVIRSILHEFEKSKFIPAFFEVRIGNDQKGLMSAPSLTLDDGTEIKFRGTVDRVDLYKSGEKVFIRIVDYKTGSKTFSLDNVKKGLNLQMLLYLFALCRSDSTTIKEAIGADKNAELLPAGVTYLVSKFPSLTSDTPVSESEIAALAEGELVRDSYFVAEEEILRALNSDLDPKYVTSIKYNEADGSVSGKSVASLENFYALEEEINATVSKIAQSIKSGDASATPMTKEKPCNYCAMKPICRSHVPKEY